MRTCSLHSWKLQCAYRIIILCIKCLDMDVFCSCVLSASSWNLHGFLHLKSNPHTSCGRFFTNLQCMECNFQKGLPYFATTFEIHNTLYAKYCLNLPQRVYIFHLEVCCRDFTWLINFEACGWQKTFYWAMLKVLYLLPKLNLSTTSANGNL